MLVLVIAACTETTPVTVTVLPDIGTTPMEVTPSEPSTSPDLVLNELQAKNASTWMDEYFELHDWAELINVSDDPVELSAAELADPSGPIWVGQGTLGPGERLLVVADGIDASGEFLELSVGGEVRERIATGVMPADVSWARFPDGGSWLPTARPTPGQPNGNRPSETLDPSDALFDTLLPIELTLPPESVASLYSSPLEETPAAIGIDGIWFPDVSIHLKGVYGSFRSLDQKAAFSIDLNEYSSHEFRGLETLKLNNMVQDSTYVHEALAYRVFRAFGVPAPRTGWARVSLNGVDYGLYSFIEAEDDTFVGRWFADKSGNLYEGSYGVDFYDGYENSFECDECADPTDRTDITAVTTILDSPASDENVAALEVLFDVDEFLTEQAVEAILLHWDGYETANNYRVYHDPTSGQFSMIPWGTDQTFIYRWIGPYDGYGRLLQWCLSNGGCADRYGQILLDVADGFENLGLLEQMEADLLFLEDEIATDPRREWGRAQRSGDLIDTVTALNEGADWIRAVVR